MSKKPWICAQCRSMVSTRSAPGHGDQVGHQLGRDRHARLVLAVLPGVAEVRDHRRDPARRGALGRVQHDQQLHQVVRRGRRRLHDEDVAAADVLVDLDRDLPVLEARHRRRRRAARPASRRWPAPARGWRSPRRSGRDPSRSTPGYEIERARGLSGPRREQVDQDRRAGTRSAETGHGSQPRAARCKAATERARRRIGRYVEHARPSQRSSCPPSAGWGGRIRTSECEIQSLVPYRLATPHQQNGISVTVRPSQMRSRGGWLLAQREELRREE